MRCDTSKVSATGLPVTVCQSQSSSRLRQTTSDQASAEDFRIVRLVLAPNKKPFGSRFDISHRCTAWVSGDHSSLSGTFGALMRLANRRDECGLMKEHLFTCSKFRRRTLTDCVSGFPHGTELGRIARSAWICYEIADNNERKEQGGGEGGYRNEAKRIVHAPLLLRVYAQSPLI